MFVTDFFKKIQSKWEETLHRDVLIERWAGLHTSVCPSATVATEARL